MSVRKSGLFIAASLLAAGFAFGATTPAPPANYTPDPQIEQLIQQAGQRDKAAAQEAIEKLIALGAPAEQALNWHLFKESSSDGRARYAELLSRCVKGKTGYRITVELQPDGSGTLTLWSDRSLLGACGKRYDRLLGKPERVISDDELKRNVYSKGELFECLNDGVKPLESRVEPHGDSVVAVGILSFKNFEALANFADRFDGGGYYMLAGATLTDGPSQVRTYQYKKAAEENRDQVERNLLLFHDLRWEFVLDFKGRITNNNAQRTDGARLVWNFNCHQMLSGQAQVQASFDAAGLPPRSGPREDRALRIPPSVQANQPLAVVRQNLIRAKVCRKPEGQTLTTAELRERGELVELDGRDSLPKGQAIEYRWTQTFGADLSISEQHRALARVPLIVREAGEYRFELVVSANGMTSKPAEVRVLIEDDANPTAAKPQPAPETAAIQPPPPLVAPPPPPPVVATAPASAKSQEPKAKSPEPDPARAKELRAQGQKLLKSLQYSEAKEVLAQAASLQPDDLECQFDLGIALMESGDVSAAISRFEEVTVNSKNAAAVMNIGHCHARAGNLGEAGRWYRKGAAIGKDAVLWEPRWQLGNNDLRKKDFAAALRLLQDAEKSANESKVRDWRLLRDLAIALHGCGKDAEALEKLTALQELGYTPDAQLLAEVKKAAESAPKPVEVAKPEPPPKKVEPAKPIEPPKPSEVAKPSDPPKTESKSPAPASVAVTKPPEPPPVSKTQEPAPADVVEVSQAKPAPVIIPTPPPPSPAVKPVEKTEPPVAAKKPETTARAEKPPAPKSVETPPAKKTEQPKETKKAPPSATPAKTESPKPVEPKAAPKKPDPTPAPPKKPLPPIPADVDQARAAGKKSYQEGARQMGLNTDDGRSQAAHCWDVAEAMYRGAWAQKPGDETVVAAFKELAKYAHAIALVRNTHVRAKVKGLVVLDAEPSIVPEKKPLYCVWEQVGGEDLGLRPENLAQKKVGVRILKPGTYKFDLAVSDGERGGSPITVTVEVTE